MSWATNYAKLLTERPRVLELLDRDGAREPPPGRERVRPAAAARQLGPLLGFIAEGQVAVPAEQQVRVGKALEHLARQAQRTGDPRSDEEE